MAVSSDGNWIASASNDCLVFLWDANGESTEPHRRLEGHNGGVTSVCFAPDGDWLATSSNDNTVKIWNIADGNNVRSSCCRRDCTHSLSSVGVP